MLQTETIHPVSDTGISTWSSRGAAREVRVAVAGITDDTYKGGVWLEIRDENGYMFAWLPASIAEAVGTDLIKLGRDAEHDRDRR